jgi:hypothetical protein
LYTATRPRDINGDGHVNQGDVATIRSALVAAGSTPSNPLGYLCTTPGLCVPPLINVSGF